MPPSFNGRRFRREFGPRTIRLRSTWLAGLVCALILSHGCQPRHTPDLKTDTSTGSSPSALTPTEPVFAFEDVTDRSGVTFTYKNGEEALHYSILESLGGGIGVIDVDNDHAEDLLIPGGGWLDEKTVPHGLAAGLFRNQGNMTFTSAAAIANVDGSMFYSHGTAVTDFNNDGFADCVVTGYGGLQLFQNLGDGTFQEQSRSAQLLDDLWSSSAAWGDFNGDGSADLYVAHYVDWSPENHPFCRGPTASQREICPPRQFNGLTDIVYFSNGDGTFRNVSSEVGLSPQGKGLGVVAADLDGDHDLDVYVTNDSVENFLYENERGTFKDVSLLSGASVSERGVPEGSMGVDAFDFNRDGQLDIWVVNYENESASLCENAGSMQFRHVSQRTGVTAAGGGLFVGWGTCPFDVDLNGFEDIFVSNGHVIRFPVNSPVQQKPLLLQNQQGNRFRNVATTAGSYMTTDHPGRGAAAADLDGDGLLDLVISNNNLPVAVLRNKSDVNGGWIQLGLIGTTSSRSAIGTVVQVTCSGQTQTRQLKGGGSYSSSNSPRIHFGIPQNSGPVDITVTWPSGRMQTIKAISDSRYLSVVEGREHALEFSP